MAFFFKNYNWFFILLVVNGLACVACHLVLHCYNNGNCYQDEICVNGRCICPLESLHSDNGICLKKVNLGDACNHTAQCQHIPSATCKNGKCACRDQQIIVDGNCIDFHRSETVILNCGEANYIIKDGKCIVGIGASCSNDTMCGIDHSTCVRPIFVGKKNSLKDYNYCSCQMEYVHVNGECLKIATKYEDQCESDEQCFPLSHDLKCINGNCVCATSHHKCIDVFTKVQNPEKHNAKDGSDSSGMINILMIILGFAVLYNHQFFYL
uniref:CSON003440 protein n=1 Tax=Culicoides sonorensis TaxID=179676 RepID=A0A336L1L2_CULSO